MGFEHLYLGVLVRVSHGNTRHKAVPLGLGEGVSALHFDRILGCHHHEGLVKFVRVSVHGDLVLFHTFKKRGLGLGRGAIDFVTDNDVREDGSRAELELSRCLVVDGYACYVRGEEIGGELNAADRAVDGPGQGLGEEGFTHARDVFKEKVPLGEQHCEGEPRSIGLTVNDGIDGAKDPLACGVERCGIHGGSLVSVKACRRFGDSGIVPSRRGDLIYGRAAVRVHLQPFSPGSPVRDSRPAFAHNERSQLFVPDY